MVSRFYGYNLKKKCIYIYSSSDEDRCKSACVKSAVTNFYMTNERSVCLWWTVLYTTVSHSLGTLFFSLTLFHTYSSSECENALWNLGNVSPLPQIHWLEQVHLINAESLTSLCEFGEIFHLLEMCPWCMILRNASRTDCVHQPAPKRIYS